MHSFRINKSNYTAPSKFSELNQYQFIQLMRILNSNMAVLQARLHILMLITVKNSPDWWRKWRNILLYWQMLFSSKEEIDEMLYMVDWVLDGMDLKQKEIFFTENLIKQVKIGTKTLFGPADYCKNLVFLEFIKCDTYFQNYAQSQKTTYLDKLIAVLYRQKTQNYNPLSPEFKGDIREIYNDYTVEERAKLVARLDPAIKQGILLFYASCRKKFVEQYPEVFQSSGKKSRSTAGWAGILRKMAGNAVAMEQYGRLRLSTALLDLKETVIEAEEMKKELEKSRK